MARALAMPPPKSRRGSTPSRSSPRNRTPRRRSTGPSTRSPGQGQVVTPQAGRSPVPPPLVGSPHATQSHGPRVVMPVNSQLVGWDSGTPSQQSRHQQRQQPQPQQPQQPARQRKPFGRKGSGHKVSRSTSSSPAVASQRQRSRSRSPLPKAAARAGSSTRATAPAEPTTHGGKRPAQDSRPATSTSVVPATVVTDKATHTAAKRSATPLRAPLVKEAPSEALRRSPSPVPVKEKPPPTLHHVTLPDDEDPSLPRLKSDSTNMPGDRLEVEHAPMARRAQRGDTAAFPAHDVVGTNPSDDNESGGGDGDGGGGSISVPAPALAPAPPSPMYSSTQDTPKLLSAQDSSTPGSSASLRRVTLDSEETIPTNATPPRPTHQWQPTPPHRVVSMFNDARHDAAARGAVEAPLALGHRLGGYRSGFTRQQEHSGSLQSLSKPNPGPGNAFAPKLLPKRVDSRESSGSGHGRSLSPPRRQPAQGHADGPTQPTPMPAATPTRHPVWVKRRPSSGPHATPYQEHLQRQEREMRARAMARHGEHGEVAAKEPTTGNQRTVVRADSSSVLAVDPSPRATGEVGRVAPGLTIQRVVPSTAQAR